MLHRKLLICATSFINFYFVAGSLVVALNFDNGIVLASDGQLQTLGSSFISGSSYRKMFILSRDSALCFVSENVDNSILREELSTVILDHTNSESQPPTCSSIAKIARRLAYLKYSKAHIVIAGLNRSKVNKCESNCVIKEILPGGSIVEHPNGLVAGSGADYVREAIENHMKLPAHALSRENAVSIAESLIKTSMHHDINTGGIGHILVFTKNGLEESRKFLKRESNST